MYRFTQSWLKKILNMDFWRRMKEWRTLWRVSYEENYDGKKKTNQYLLLQIWQARSIITTRLIALNTFSPSYSPFVCRCNFILCHSKIYFQTRNWNRLSPRFKWNATNFKIVLISLICCHVSNHNVHITHITFNATGQICGVIRLLQIYLYCFGIAEAFNFNCTAIRIESFLPSASSQKSVGCHLPCGNLFTERLCAASSNGMVFIKTAFNFGTASDRSLAWNSIALNVLLCLLLQLGRVQIYTVNMETINSAYSNSRITASCYQSFCQEWTTKELTKIIRN